jgi:hypothetical protein
MAEMVAMLTLAQFTAVVPAAAKGQYFLMRLYPR